MSESLTTTSQQKERAIVVSQGRPPYPLRAKEAFGISPGDWRALVDAVWPSAKTTEAVELALSYCRARKLDPFKRPVHIVPVWDSKLRREVETIWPGIGELRTTASRTGQWAGNDDASFGEPETRSFKGVVGREERAKEVEKTVTFPAWCQFVVYKIIQGQRVPFRGPRVIWLETYATMGNSDVPNEMWATRPYGQLEKCAEAAALRRAFPEEVGNEYIPEEAGRSRGPAIEVTALQPGESRADALLQRLSGLEPPETAPESTISPEPVPQHSPDGDRGSAWQEAPKTRDALVEEVRALAKPMSAEEKAEAFQRHFLVPSWLQLTKLPADTLAAGLASLRREIDGLAEMKAEGREREPGEEE